jgi:cephalosporin-C deacetylase-like acetyl esterase
MVPLKHEKQCPAVIFGHGYTGSKNDVLSALPKIASKGFCALSIDFWYHGDRSVEGKKMYSTFLYEMRSGLSLSVVDLRRAVDFLETRPEVDKDRITYVGGSMGGILGGLFASVDNRVKAPILIVAGGNWPYLLKNSIVGQVDLKFSYNDSVRLSNLSATALAPVDTLNLVQYISPRPLLMLNAKHDILVNPFTNKQMFLRAGIPKKIVWFDSDHDVPIDDAINIVMDWYDKYLINGHAPDFTSSVEGYKTSPVNINDKIKLPPIVSGITYNEYFRYNRDLPLLSSRDSDTSPNPRVSKFKISFQSTLDRIVEGTLNLPTKGEPPYPCVIFVHDFGGTPEDVDFIADILARNGVASVSVGLYSFLSGDSNPFLSGVNLPGPQNMAFNNKLGKTLVGAKNTNTGFVIYPSYEYEFRDLVKQTVQDIQRTVDMLYKYEAILKQSLTLVGVGMGANVSLIAAATDERISGVYLFEPYESIIPYTQIKSGKTSSGETASNENVNRDNHNNIKVVQPDEYVQNLGTKEVTIFHRTVDGKVYINPKLYNEAKEPKEMVTAEGSSDGVSKWIGTALKSVAAFVKTIVTRTSPDGLKRAVESRMAIETPSSQLNKWEKAGSTAKESKKCAVQALELAEKPVEGGRTAILNSRIGPCAGKNATVIAEIIGNVPAADYVQLFDNGEGFDNKEGDGIFSAGYDLPKDVENIYVTVGGVGDAGEAIIEKTAQMK